VVIDTWQIDSTRVGAEEFAGLRSDPFFIDLLASRETFRTHW
jgi:hypothetical protein